MLYWTCVLVVLSFLLNMATSLQKTCEPCTSVFDLFFCLGTSDEVGASFNILLNFLKVYSLYGQIRRETHPLRSCLCVWMWLCMRFFFFFGWGMTSSSEFVCKLSFFASMFFYNIATTSSWRSIELWFHFLILLFEIDHPSTPWCIDDCKHTTFPSLLVGADTREACTLISFAKFVDIRGAAHPQHTPVDKMTAPSMFVRIFCVTCFHVPCFMKLKSF